MYFAWRDVIIIVKELPREELLKYLSDLKYLIQPNAMNYTELLFYKTNTSIMNKIAKLWKTKSLSYNKNWYKYLRTRLSWLTLIIILFIKLCI